MKTLIVALMAFGTMNAFAETDSSFAPNPAAQFCIQEGGGAVWVLRGADGDEGYCIMGRSMIDEWTLFRYASKMRMAQEAVAQFLAPRRLRRVRMARGGGSSAGVPTPAEYCTQVGGHSFVMKDPARHAYGMCGFKDGSSIEETTLLRGAQDESNAALTALLRR